MRVFSVSGWSQSGKTTLVEKIIKNLSVKGYSVASLKSSHTEHTDKLSSDTHRHKIAGANPSILLGTHQTTIRYDERFHIHDFSCLKTDFLIIEGMKKSKIPKIWCDKTLGDSWREFPEVRAIVIQNKSDTKEIDGLPIIESNQIEAVITLILKHAIAIEDIS